ncbi:MULTISPECIES: acetyltransferase [Exiguobacterium]|uniref:acetyltransferase n=1 Tax=Exiguobacterium TaxID=33986 RepID=UPI001BE85508|nr:MULTISPECIES: acetyltransferase [Exiguobacterium]MCT4781650.1 acetyltransferase [Exiguobacterium himgiriensis]
MEDIVLFGAGGHTKVVIDIVEQMERHHIIGIYDDRPELMGTTYFGYPVLGPIRSDYAVNRGIIGIGNNDSRALVSRIILEQAPEFEFVHAIHPSACIGRDVTIGAGAVVMAGAVINPSTTIGPHCIINTMASVDHDCRVDAFASVGPGTHLGGNVHVMGHSFVGIGATVIHQVTIGSESVIGAGATVVHDIPNNVIAIGSPAKPIRTRETNEKFL